MEATVFVFLQVFSQHTILKLGNITKAVIRHLASAKSAYIIDQNHCLLTCLKINTNGGLPLLNISTSSGCPLTTRSFS